MAGSINNEDYQLIDVAKGVYVTHPIAVPDGYAYKLTNFVIKDGVVGQRSSILPISSDSRSTPNGWYGDQLLTYPIYEINLPIASTNKTMLAAFVAPKFSSRAELVGILTPGGDLKRLGKILPAATLSGALVVYNIHLYAGTTAGVIRIDISNFPTSIVEVAIPASPTNLAKMIAHKSRLFGFNNASGTTTNRLYFTDAPSVGGLPETWNTTTNFIDFNGASGSTKIWDIISLNNYIYVFTNNGLFSLYTSGSPSNWVVRLINPDIAIYSYLQVVVRNSLIYFVAEDGVYVTDGFDFKLISQPLSNFFTATYQARPESINLSPFDGGLLLNCNKPVDGSLSTCFYTRLDSIAWTEIDFCPDSADGGPTGGIASASVVANDIYDPSSGISIGSGTKSFVVMYHTSYPGSSYNNFIYESSILNTSANTNLGVDTFLTLTGSAVTGQVTRSINLTLATKELVGSNFMRLKFFRDFMLMFGSEFPYSIASQIWWNGKGYPTPLSLPTQDAPNTNIPTLNPHGDLMHSLVKIGFNNQLALSCRLQFNITLLQTALLKQMQDRFMFSLLAAGYTTELERTGPRSQAAGSF